MVKPKKRYPFFSLFALFAFFSIYSIGGGSGYQAEAINRKGHRASSLDLSSVFSFKTVVMVSGICGSIFAGNVFLGKFDPDPVFSTANDIPKHYFDKKESIDAVVVKVIDGDTYRVRHVNSWHKNPSFDGKLSDNTISVRIAAVDTPEIGKAGNKGQPFSAEAKEYATKKIEGKKVLLQLLAKDKYGRVLGFVKYKDTRGIRFLWNRQNDMSEQLLKRGLAVVYRQGGAQYGDETIEKW